MFKTDVLSFHFCNLLFICIISAPIYKINNNEKYSAGISLNEDWNVLTFCRLIGKTPVESLRHSDKQLLFFQTNCTFYWWRWYLLSSWEIISIAFWKSTTKLVILGNSTVKLAQNKNYQRVIDIVTAWKLNSKPSQKLCRQLQAQGKEWVEIPKICQKIWILIFMIVRLKRTNQVLMLKLLVCSIYERCTSIRYLSKRIAGWKLK